MDRRWHRTNTDDQIYENLFKEGVLVAPKDFNRPEHPDMPVRNLEVIKAMQSLTSKGFVKTQFSWQWYYYSLTDEGLAYLREYLNIPSEIVPQTHMKPARPAGRPSGYGGGGERREGGAYKAPRGGDREYRRRDDAGDKEGASGEFRPVSETNPNDRVYADDIRSSVVSAEVPVLPLLRRIISNWSWAIWPLEKLV
jgi:small subunit ribosomal protein S10e